MPPTTRSKRKHQQAELEDELLTSARQGNMERVRELVEIERVSVDCVSKYGFTPLIVASIYGFVQVARFLLDSDANVDAVNNYDCAALGYAVHDRNVALAELLLEYGAYVEARLFGDRSLLAEAIIRRDVGMVRLLLRYGANTQETLYYGRMYTALYLACLFVSRGDEIDHRVEIVQLLLDQDDGVDVNDFSPSNGDLPAMSPLCAACRNNRLELVQLLVQNGARVVHDGVYPDTPCPLKRAVEKGSLELIRFLLDNSPLTNQGALVVAPDDFHPLSLPLETALRSNKLEVAQLLVDHGANVNNKPFLDICARAGSCKGAGLLLKAGANVNRVNERGETPLWVAAALGNAELVKEFLKSGADASIRDNTGEKPLEVARRNGHKGIIYLLLRTSPAVWPRLRASW